MRSIAALLSLSLISCDGCDEETRLRQQETREGKALASASQTDQTIKPVYPAKVGEVPPLVTRLCEALHGLPRKKRAECCQTGVGVVLTSECERNLTGAVSNGALALEEQQVAACERAIGELHAGCDWIGPWQPPVPSACLAIGRGTKTSGEECRSNLECFGDLRCLGVGPTDAGVCGAPPPIGSICGASVDTLAVYTRQDDVERKHPACLDGFCDRSRCVAFVEEGSACSASVQCRSRRCVEGKCAADGIASCSGGECDPGMRCIAGTCQEPKSLGSACTDDRECKSACLSGTCQMRCLSPAILRGLIKTRGQAPDSRLQTPAGSEARPVDR